MALIAGPGIGGGHSPAGTSPTDLTLVVDKHVNYIQGLDSVRGTVSVCVSSDIDDLPA